MIPETKMWDAMNCAALVLLDRDLAEDFMKEVARRLEKDVSECDLRVQLAAAEDLARQYSDSLAKTADDRSDWRNRAQAAEAQLERAQNKLKETRDAFLRNGMHEMAAGIDELGDGK